MAEQNFWNEKKDLNWFKNFWFYYKLKIFFGALLLAFIAWGIVSCTNLIDYDLVGYYIGEDPITDQFEAKTKAEFTKLIDDINENGKVDFDFQNLTAGDVDKITSESDYSMQTAIQFEMLEGEGYLYLLDKVFYKYCIKMELLEDISKITGNTSPDYAIQIDNNSIIKSLGYENNKKLYMAVRILNTKQRSENEESKKQENALKVLEYFYKNK